MFCVVCIHPMQCFEQENSKVRLDTELVVIIVVVSIAKQFFGT
jgi:hypothetical protein